MIGNSSAGIMEAEVYGVPTINIGTRQKNRTKNKNIINIDHNKENILNAIKRAENMRIEYSSYFGDGNSVEKFYEILLDEKTWGISIQKQFVDLKL